MLLIYIFFFLVSDHETISRSPKNQLAHFTANNKSDKCQCFPKERKMYTKYLTTNIFIYWISSLLAQNISISQPQVPLWLRSKMQQRCIALQLSSSPLEFNTHSQPEWWVQCGFFPTMCNKNQINGTKHTQICQSNYAQAMHLIRQRYIPHSPLKQIYTVTVVFVNGYLRRISRLRHFLNLTRLRQPSNISPAPYPFPLPLFESVIYRVMETAI